MIQLRWKELPWRKVDGVSIKKHPSVVYIDDKPHYLQYRESLPAQGHKSRGTVTEWKDVEVEE